MATPATGSGNTISQVQFYQGTTLIGTANAPTTTNGNSYSVNWTNAAANSYNVTAKATDSKNNTASSPPITVNVINNNPPTVSMTASPANATAPATIILNATAADSDGTVAQVEFFNGTTSIGVVTQAPFTSNWVNVAPGSYSITAKATDNLGATTTSAPVPVAVTANVPKVYDVHNDQLGTPRVITDSTGTEVWRWDSAPFGETPPNEQPANQASKFSFNMRFPGQYFDAETNLHYNYFRDYDPQAGRYVESDRIGLSGGINTYGYVGGNPIILSDSYGLQAITVFPTLPNIPDRGIPLDFIAEGATIFGKSIWDKDIPSEPQMVICYIDKYSNNYPGADRDRGDRDGNPGLVYDLGLRDAAHYLDAYENGAGYGMQVITYNIMKWTTNLDAHKASKPGFSDIYWSIKGAWDGYQKNPKPKSDTPCLCKK